MKENLELAAAILIITYLLAGICYVAARLQIAVMG